MQIIKSNHQPPKFYATYQRVHWSRCYLVMKVSEFKVQIIQRHIDLGYKFLPSCFGTVIWNVEGFICGYCAERMLNATTHTQDATHL